MAGAIVIAGCLTAVMMLFSLVGLYPLMRLLKTPESILSESYSYISVLTIFIGVMFAYNLCAGLLRAIGNSLMPLLFLIFSSIGNVLLDLLFITQFDMGIRGAAIATVVAQGISVLLCIFYILRHAAVLVPERRHFAAGKHLYGELAYPWGL